jgi:chromosome segregation ATPase
MKGFVMKKLFAVLMLSAVVLLAGCQNPELINCQEENQSLQASVSALQQDLNAAKEALTKKDKTIENLRSENVDMQNKAMESIKTMMERQAVKDQELKDKLASAQQQAKQLTGDLARSTQELDRVKTELVQVKAERDRAVEAAKAAKAAAEAAEAAASSAADEPVEQPAEAQ